MNIEKLQAIVTKLSAVLGLESEDKLQELAAASKEDEEEKEQEQPEPTEESEPEAEAEEKEDEEVEAEGEEPETDEVAQLNERFNELAQTISSILADVEALKQSKEQTEEENTQLKEKLSAVENTPADQKINFNAQTLELSPAQRRLKELRAMQK